MSVTFTADVVEHPSAPVVNVNVSNAVRLLGVLGYPAEDALGGEVSAGEFLGRVLLALAVEPDDAGMPGCEAPDHGRFIECGRLPGYLQDRLRDLHELAEWCQERSSTVTWVA